MGRQTTSAAPARSAALANGTVDVRVNLTTDGMGTLALSRADAPSMTPFLSGGPLLAFTALTADAAIALPFDAMIETEGPSIRLTGAHGSFSYELSYRLAGSAGCVIGTARFRTARPIRGWFHARCTGPREATYWIYPWLNGGRDIVPTLGNHRLHMDVPGHIHAQLAGVPLLIARAGDTIGGLGFSLAHDYHHDSLAFERGIDEVGMGVGSGRNEGSTAFHGGALYRPGIDYSFSFQIFAVHGSFRELARHWQAANNFSFDTTPYYGLDEALAMAVKGRKPARYGSTDRYVRDEVRSMQVRGYRHSSHQSRISVYRQALNAYVDFLLHKESGDPVFLERSREQVEFLLASQHASGWYEEDWQIGERDFSYEVIGQDGGVTQTMAEQDRIMPKPNESLIWGDTVVSGPRVVDPATGRNIKGPRPDYLGISCLYLHKLIVEAHAIEPETRNRWKSSLDRCLAWILSVQRGDGSFPMTVTRDGSVSADSAPCSRLLVALDRIAADRGDDAVATACGRHEAWVLEHCVANQCWWGSHKDTGLTIDYGGLQTFVQYCIQRFERTRERRYVDLAVECTYYNFFEHCPKQLEWLWHRSTGGIQEQSNYLQPDIDTMDNLVLSSWYRLAQVTGDAFLRGFVDQQVSTTMHTLCDEPSNDWYGAWAQYLVDYADAVGRFDQDPVTENRTKYAGSITPSVIEDMLLLLAAGYTPPA